MIPGKIELYRIAFIHKSVIPQRSNGPDKNNERLEYLGDAILDAVTADYLFQVFPGEDEGFLTQLKSKIVKRKQLNKLADNLGIGSLLQANTNNTQFQRNLHGNALEALIGAIYLDKGYPKTKKFIINHILIRYLDLGRLAGKESDFKSRIIEWAQKHKQEISFISQEESLPDSNETFFSSQVILSDQELGTGTGHSKKDAEQKAAEEALTNIQQ